jgi:hypothetical protein
MDPAAGQSNPATAVEEDASGAGGGGAGAWRLRAGGREDNPPATGDCGGWGGCGRGGVGTGAIASCQRCSKRYQFIRKI